MENLHENTSAEKEITEKESYFPTLPALSKRVQVGVLATLIILGLSSIAQNFFINPKMEVRLTVNVWDEGGNPVSDAIVSVSNKSAKTITNEAGVARLVFDVRKKDRKISINVEQNEFEGKTKIQEIIPEQSRLYEMRFDLNKLTSFKTRPNKSPFEIITMN